MPAKDFAFDLLGPAIQYALWQSIPETIDIDEAEQLYQLILSVKEHRQAVYRPLEKRIGDIIWSIAQEYAERGEFAQADNALRCMETLGIAENKIVQSFWDKVKASL